MNNFPVEAKKLLSEQIKEIERSLAETPTDMSLQVRLGKMYQSVGRLGDARGLFRTVLGEIDVESSPALAVACYMNLGRVAMGLGHNKTAISWLNSAKRILEKIGESQFLGEIYRDLALAHWANGGILEATSLLEQAAPLLPETTDLYALLAEVYGASNMHAKQQKAWSQMWASRAKQIATSSEDTSNPDQAHIHLFNGMSLEFQGKYDEAVNEFEKAILNGLGNSEVYWRLGLCLSETERIPEAIRALKKAIELDPTAPRAYTDLGVVYQKIGMKQIAVSQFKAALERDPLDIDANLKLVNAYLDLNQPVLALDLANKVLDLLPQDDRLLYFVGKAEFALGRPVNGYRAWQKALEIVKDERLKNTYEMELRELEQRIAPSTLVQRTKALEIATEAGRLKLAGRLEQAIDQFRYAAEIDSYFLDALTELASAYVDSDKLTEAQRVLERVIQQFPENQNTYLELANVLLRLGDKSAARENFYAAHALAPHTSQGVEAKIQLTRLEVEEQWGSVPVQRYDEGMTFLHAGEMESAIQVFQQARALAPRVALFVGMLGWCYLVVDRIDNAILALNEAVQLDPDDLGCQAYLAMAFMKKEMFRDALMLLQNGISIQPDNWYLHNSLGICYEMINKGVLAEEEFRRAIEYNPENAAIRLTLSQNLIERKKIGQAQKELEEIVRFFSDSPETAVAKSRLEQISMAATELRGEAQDNRTVQEQTDILCDEGEILDQAGFTPAAIEKYQEAVAENFDAFRPHFRLGNAYVRIGENTRAIAEYEFAVLNVAENWRIADAYYNMGNIYRAIENFARAAEFYRKAIEVYPEIRDAQENHALWHRVEGNYAEAIKQVQAELKSHPDKVRSATPHFNLGLWLQDLGKSDEALFELKKAILLDPKIGAFHESLGTLFLLRGNLWNLAQLEYDQALDLNPNNERARRGIEALNFIEYEWPRYAVHSDNPRVEHSFQYHTKQIEEENSAFARAHPQPTIEYIREE